MLTIVPISIRDANALVERWHRHHKPVRGAKFAIGIAVQERVCGAAIVGRPVARRNQDGWTLEVTRCVTDGTRNACSALYRAAWRAVDTREWSYTPDLSEILGYDENDRPIKRWRGFDYYFDADAISEPASSANEMYWAGVESGLHSGESHAGTGKSTRRFKNTKPVSGWDTGPGSHQKLTGRYPPSKSKHNGEPEQAPGRRMNENTAGARVGVDDHDSPFWPRRNKRSVWTVKSSPYPEAHFATFPPALVEPCVLAGSRPGDIVFDPFIGSGTTGEVAQRLGRRWIGIELNQNYAALAEQRTGGTVGMVFA